MRTWLGIVSLGVVVGLGGSAVAEDNQDGDDNGGRDKLQRVFRAQLVGYNEVPSVSTAARGEFYAVLNKEETELKYWLSYSNLTSPASQSHIHVGQHHTNGGISVWLCEGTLPAPTASTPTCAPQSTTGPIMGVITSAEIIGPPAQGIAATELAELIAAMRAGAAYANVHSVAAVAGDVAFPGGEIRGQIH
jgi:hypothetical protein